MPQITVDTGMNTKPVLQGVKQMQSAIRSVNSIIGKIGKSLDASVVGYANAMSNNAKATRNLNDSIHVIEGTIANLQLQMNELANTKIDTKEYADLKKQIEGAEKELQKLVDAQKRLKDLGRDSVQTKEYTAIVKEAENAKKEVEQLQAAYDKIDTRSSLARGSAKSIKKRIEEEKKNYAEYGKQANIAARKAQKAGIDTDIGQQYTAEKNRLLAMREESGRKIGSYSKSLSRAESDAKKYEQVLDDIGNKLDGAEKKYNGLISKQKELEQTGGATKMTEAMRTSQYEIKRVTDKVKELEAEKKKLEDSGKATINGQETEEYKNATAQLEQAKHDLQQTQNAVAERTAPLHEKEWAEMATASHAVAEGLARVQNAANTAGYAIQHPLQAIDRLIPMAVSGLATLARKVLDVAASFGKWAINTIVSGVRRLASAALNAAVSLARMAGSAVISFLQRLGNAAKNAALNLARVAGNAVVGGLKKIGSAAANAGKALLGFGKSARKSNGGLKDALKMIVRYGFGVRSVFMLVRRLRSALVAAFQNMAQKVPEVNKALSKLSASLGMLKNSMATAFQPILTAIAPMLSTLMDMLSEALTKVGMFFAALTGQDYVYKATKANVDYAKSLDKTKKSAKEAENQLASFDKLDILKDNKNDNNDEDTSGGFEKTPVLNQIKSFANSLKDLFSKGDFAKLGEMLASKVNNFFKSIDWDGWATKVSKVANAALELYNAFMEKIDWEGIGAGIGTFINGILRDLDFDALGRALAQRINAIVGILYGIVTTVDWGQMGKQLAAAVWGYFGSIKWDKIGETIATAVNGIAETITNFATNYPWVEMGKKLASGANKLFGGINWYDLAVAICTIFDKALDGLLVFITDFKWAEHGEEFKKGIMKIVEDFPLQEMIKSITNGLHSAMAFILPTIQDPAFWQGIGKQFASALNTLFGDTKMWDALGKVVNSMLLGVLELGDTFVNEFNPVQAGHSIALALSKIDWPGIASGVWRVLKAAFNKAGSFVDALLSEPIDPEKAGMSGEYLAKVTAFNQQSIGTKLGIRLKEAFNAIPWDDIASSLWGAAKTAFSQAGDFVLSMFGIDKKTIEKYGKSPFTAIGEKIHTSIKDALGDITWSDIADTVWGAIKKAFTAAGDFILALFGIDESTIEKYGKTKFEAIAAKIGGMMQTVGQELGKLPWGEYLKAAGSAIWTVISGFFTGLFNGEGEGTILGLVIAGIAALKLGIIPLLSKLVAGFGSALMASGPFLQGVILAVLGGVIVVGTNYIISATKEMGKLAEERLNSNLTEMDTILSGYTKEFRENGIEAANEWASHFGIDLEGGNIVTNLRIIWDEIQQQQGSSLAVITSDLDGALATYRAIWVTEGAEAANAWAESALNMELTSEGVSEDIRLTADDIDGNINRLAIAIGQNQEQIVNDVGGTADKTKKYVDEAMTEIDTTTKEKAENAKDNIVTSFEESTMSVEQLEKQMTESAQQAWGTDIPDAVQEGTDAYNKKLQESNTQAESDTTTHNNAILGAFGAMFTGIVTSAAAMTMLNLIVSTGMSTMSNTMTTTLDTINNTFGTTMTSIKNTATTGMSGAVEAVVRGASTMSGNVTRIFSEMVRSIQNIGWQSLGNSIASQINSGLSNGAASLRRTASSLADDVAREFKGNSWWSVGDNMVAGIIDGINDNWPYLERTARKKAESLYKTVCNELGIHSPSRLFRDGVGKMIGLGIAEGMDKSQPAIIESVVDAADAMAAKMNSTDMQFEVGTSLDTFGDKIADSFTTLMDRLQAIADTVTFRTPAVAAGTVLPYNVAAQTENPPDGLVEALTASNDDMASVVIQATNNAAMAIVQAIQRISGQGNGDLSKQTSQIIDEINRRARAQGASPIIV